MTITTGTTGTPVIRPGPRVDASTVTELRREIHAAIDATIGAGAEELVIDLSDVAILDAAGLGMLVAAHRRATSAGGTLTLVSVPPGVGRLLAVTRLHKLFRVERSDRAERATPALQPEIVLP